MNTIEKIKRKINSIIISKTRKYFFYPMLYKSWWHCFFKKNVTSKNSEHYFGSIPNPGAGIGHQLANWIAGYWYAQQFGLKFVHIPFANSKWENFLGFYENTQNYKELINLGYKEVKLPLFVEKNLDQIQKIKEIIQSYSDKKVVFITEQDQFYADQYGVEDDIKELFYSSKARKNEKLVYDANSFNIAIHVRRGDITVGQLNQNPNLLMRWQDNDYFVNVLKNVLKELDTDKQIKIYLFSQGKKEDFKEFNEFNDIVYCLDMGAQESFLHMVYADLLITSKSSFSYKPALLSNGIKISPKNFWHGYPNRDDWILSEEDGILISYKILKTNFVDNLLDNFNTNNKEIDVFNSNTTL